MAEKTTKKASAKVPTPRSGAEHETAKSTPAAPRSGVARTVDLSEDVLASVEKGQRAAIEAVRKFVETVDEALPSDTGRPSVREKVIDAALDMADDLVTMQYSFLRTVVRDAGRTIGTTGAGKK